MGPSVWLIAGPTASGKSALALRLAEAFDGEVVNADSMQIYDGLRVLTARPGAAEEARVAHHLYGVADPGEAWSVGRWLGAVRPLLDRLRAAGRPAVVTGGAGLYFQALTCGLADIPTPPPPIRAAAAARFDAQGEAAFRDALSAGDSLSAARIAPGDRQRLLRAWSVLEATGRALPDWQAGTRPVLQPGDYAAAVLEPPRPTLYARCDARLEAMVAEGAVQEVERLLARRLSPDLPAMKALGVREFACALDGRLTPGEALAEAQRQTRRYAKRQTTWFRNQAANWPRITACDAAEQWRALQEMAPGVQRP